ncbi:MAG: isoprenoid biosynthesis protein ElbB [Desulfobulbaceae bacterium A2]|nr:MAG: isoprenoid biosynthesis protein ElbB [Desulfobulbaceae bacterium A2]
MAGPFTFGVVLSGCGNRDGAEIHESTLTLWAIHDLGHDYRCFAPDIPQLQVINHSTGREMAESRNVLVESARIARGRIQPLREFDARGLDALILPGGLGAAKNLSSFATAGAECTVPDELARAIREMHSLGKPIAALCIAPVILARVLPGVTVTIGNDAGVAAMIEHMGAHHRNAALEEVVVDPVNRVVSTPCYMYDARVDAIGRSARRAVEELLRLLA